MEDGNVNKYSSLTYFNSIYYIFILTLTGIILDLKEKKLLPRALGYLLWLGSVLI